MGNFIHKCIVASQAARQYQATIDERNRALENLEHQILEDTRRKQEQADMARRMERHNRLMAHAGHTYRS